MSHDIRTPMNGIIGMLEVSDRCVDDLEQVRKYHTKIQKAAEYLLSLLNDVLDMNKLEDETQAFPEESVDLLSVLTDCKELMGSQNNEKGLTFVIPTVDQFAPPRVWSSELHLRQGFLHLLSNAETFRHPGGTITVEARNLEQTEETVTCEFRVKDEGIGIGKDFQKKRFEPFTQEHSGVRSKYAGTAVSLYHQAYLGPDGRKHPGERRRRCWFMPCEVVLLMPAVRPVRS